MKLKILSYNIHKGFSWNQSKYFLKEMKQLIASADADLVFLQEVAGQNDKHRKDGLLDAQAEFLADSLWSEFAYAKNAVYDHGHHGNMILSKYPIQNWENTNISTNKFEQRGLLVCHITIPDVNMKVVAACVHLDLLHEGRKKQYQNIADKINTLNIAPDTPVVVAGDFNDWNRKASVVMEGELGMKDVHKSVHGRYARTFPAHLPFFTLDRVYVKNCKGTDARIFATSEHLSDHLPLLCEVEIAP